MLICLRQMIRMQVLDVKAELDEGKRQDGKGQKTIFYDLLQNEHLPPEDKTVDRLENEGISITAAGYASCSTASIIQP